MRVLSTWVMLAASYVRPIRSLLLTAPSRSLRSSSLRAFSTAHKESATNQAIASDSMDRPPTPENFPVADDAMAMFDLNGYYVVKG